MKPVILITLLYVGICLQAYAQPLYAPALVADICPGEEKPAVPCGGNPYFMQQYKGEMMMAGWDGLRGNLCSYDGSGKLKVYPYDNVSLFYPSYAAIDNYFYFTNYYDPADTKACEVFRWDGSSKPQRISFINPNGSSQPGEMTSLNGILYFTATNGTTGFGMYEYNPESGAFTRLNDLHIIGPTIYNGRIYFAADGPGIGRELFMYDPATHNTKLITDLNPGEAPSYPQCFIRANGLLYFMANSNDYGREIYVLSDTSTPVRLTDIAAGSKNGIGSANGADMTFLNNRLYFTASTTGDAPFDLWAFDVTTNTPARVAALYTSNITDARSFTTYGNKVIFPALNQATHTNHLYAYDAAAFTLRQLPDPFYTNSITTYLQYVYKNALYLSAKTSNYGWELYRYHDSPPPDTARTLIYPNPATTQVYINTEIGATRTLTVTISNAVGQTMTRKLMGTYPAGSYVLEVPLTHLSPGIYFCTLYDNVIGQLWTEKLVKL